MPSSPPQTTMNPQLGHLHGCSSSGGYASHVLRNILFLYPSPSTAGSAAPPEQGQMRPWISNIQLHHSHFMTPATPTTDLT